MRGFTDYQKDFATFTGNSSTTSNSTNSFDNIAWGMRMINDDLRYLTTKFYFNEVSYVVPGGTVANQQGYLLPSDFEVLMNCTIQVGGILYQPIEAPSRSYWDFLNVIVFNNDFPQFYYIYNGRILIWPTPASSSNVITINYKKRIVDLSMADVTQTTASSTVAATLNSTTITASSTTFRNWMAASGWIRIPYSTTDAQNGDNRWYQIASVTSNTVIELKNPYQGATITGASFTVSDVPLLPEDYQDIPLYKALRLYYTSRVPDPTRAKNYQALHDECYAALEDKYGQKSNSPVLTDPNMPVYNPNLFPSSQMFT